MKRKAQKLFDIMNKILDDDHCVECGTHKSKLLDSYVIFTDKTSRKRICCDRCLYLHYDGDITLFDASYDYTEYYYEDVEFK